MRASNVSGVLLAALLTAQGVLAAQEPFIPTGRVSARSAALGGTEMVLPGTAESIFSNPAALTQLGVPEVFLGAGMLASEGERQLSFSGALPLAGGLVAGLGGSFRHFPLESIWSDSDSILVSLAFPLSLNGKLAVGISGKYLHQSVPGYSGTATGGGLDLGLFYEAFSDSSGTRLDFGLAFDDAQTVLKSPDWEIQLPTIVGLGGSLRLASGTLLALAYDSHLSPVPNFESYQVLRGGLEQGLTVLEFVRLAFRLGYLQRLDADRTLTAGMGATVGDWGLDYALGVAMPDQGMFQQIAVSWAPQRANAAAATSAAAAVETTPKPTPKPTETSASLFSALDSAANLQESVRVPLVEATPTPEPVARARTRVATAVPQEEEPAYRRAVPKGPADEERASLAPELEMPGTFSGYISNLKSTTQSLQIENQALRLHVVVNPFSPNNDGRKDRTLFLGRVESENLRVDHWALNLIQSDRIVRTFKGGKRLPTNLEWDGTDDRNRPLPDGNYDALLRVFDENGMEQAAVTSSVTILTRAAGFNLPAPDTQALTGTSDDKPLVFVLPKAVRSTDWQFVLYGPGGKKVIERRGDKEIPEKIVWTPRVAGRVAADGRYRATLSFLDEAGLKASGETEFSLGYAEFGVGLSASPQRFKPMGEGGGQGVTFKPGVQGELKISQWTLTIHEDQLSQPVRVLSGVGAPPEAIVWDGKAANGSAVAGGKMFKAAFRAVSAVGTVSTVESAALQSDLGDYTGTQALTINLVRALFPAGGAELSENAKKSLLEAAGVIRKYKTDFQIRVLGHCAPNEAGGAEDRLSRQRAQVVAEFLTASGGIPAEKVESIGYGAEKPLSTGTSDEDQAKNRRSEVVLFAK